MTSPPTSLQTVDIGRWQRQELLLGMILPTLLGVGGIVAAVLGYTTDSSSTAERVIVGVLGVVFLAIGVALLVWLVHAPPVALLDVDGTGLGVRGRRGADWRLGWDTVSALSLVRAPLEVAFGLGTRGSGGTRAYFLRIRLPRHYLLVELHPRTPVPESLKSSLGPRRAAIDLGVPARAAHEAQAALGERLTDRQITRLDKAAARPIRAA